MIQQSITGATLWGALSAIAGFLTDRVGVPIRRGERPATDGQAVYLPRLPDVRLVWSQVIKVIAYLYHESGHIKWTNMADFVFPTALAKAIGNKLEDIRIERKAIETFPAAQKYLADLVRMLTEAGLAGESPCFPQVSTEESEAEILQWYMLFRLRHDVLKQEAIAPVLATAEAAVAAKLPKGMRVRLDALMFQIVECESTADVVALTAEIVQMIEEEKEKEEERAKPPPQDAGGTAPDSDDDQQQNGDNGGTSPGGSQGDDDTAQAAPSTDAAGDGDVAGTSPPAPAQADEADPAANAAALKRLLEMGDDDQVKDFGEMLQEAVGEVAATATSSASLPNIHKLPLVQQPVDMASIRGSVNAVRTRTMNWMSSSAQCEVMHSRQGIIIDSSQLYQACLGGEIFVDESEGIDLNAAIDIVVDRSISMSSRIQRAVQAALTTMLAFDVPGIKTQVTVFPVSGPGQDCEDEGIAIVKRWEESPKALASRIGSLTIDGGTPMAEAILGAAAGLLFRQETLRMVLVVTDGDPNNLEATLEVIAKARASGIAVVGVGIGDDVDTSKVFGEKHSAKLQDVGELSNVMVRLIKSAMTRH